MRVRKVRTEKEKTERKEQAEKMESNGLHLSNGKTARIGNDPERGICDFNCIGA